MNTKENMKWQALLASSAPAFDGETSPPYAFLTGTMAQLREERRQREQMEKISLRALLASMAVLVITAGITLSLHFQAHRGLELGIKNLVQMENIQVF